MGAEPMIAGALILALGILLGRVLPARKSRAGGSPKPICGCTHEMAYHDPKTGQCHALMYVHSTQSCDSHHTPCTCKQYTGPRPLPELYAPGITDG